MMSYLWILLLGSLLASHGKAQDDATAAPEPLDDVADDGEGEAVPDAGTDDVDQTTEPSPADPEPEPDADSDVVTPAPSDSEETTPSEDGEPAVEEGDGDGGDDATEAPAEEEPEPATLAADPEADVPADEETTAAPEPELLLEGGDTETESPTPGDALIVTTVAEEVLPTQGAGSGVIDVEPEQATQSVIEEVPADTEAPAVQEETGGDEKTAPAPVDEKTTPASVISEPEVALGVGPRLNTEFNLDDALDDEDEEDNQPKKTRHGSFNAEPVKEGEKTSTQEGSSKPLAAVLSAIVVSAVGAVTGYFAYQKKKLCFKPRGEADAETGHNAVKADKAEAQSDPQVLSNLLPTTQQ